MFDILSERNPNVSALELNQLVERVLRAYEEGNLSMTKPGNNYLKWDWYNSILFAGTVITTIGNKL